MQPAGLPPPMKLKPNPEKIDAFLTSAKIGNSSNIQYAAHLQLSLLGSKNRDVTKARQSFPNISLPYLLGELSPLGKISVISRFGFSQAAKILLEASKEPSGPEKVNLEDAAALSSKMEEFNTKLWKLTGQMDDGHQISACTALDVLRFRVFSALQRCRSFAEKRDIWTADQEQAYQLIEKQTGACMELFKVLEISDMDPSSLENTKNTLKRLHDDFEKYGNFLRMKLPSAKKHIESQQFIENALQLIQNAIDSPFTLFPLLLNPVQFFALSFEDVHEADAHYKRILQFIDDITLAFDFQFEVFLLELESRSSSTKKEKAVKKGNKKKPPQTLAIAREQAQTITKLKADCKTFKDRLYAYKAEILNDLQVMQAFLHSSLHLKDPSYSQLKAIRNWEAGHEQMLKDFNLEGTKILESLNKTFPHQKSGLACPNCTFMYVMNRPLGLYERLISSVGISVYQTSTFFITSFRSISEQIDPEFRGIDGLPLYELLDFSSRTDFLVLQKNPTFKGSDLLQKLQESLEQFFFICRTYSSSAPQEKTNLMERANQARASFTQALEAAWKFYGSPNELERYVHLRNQFIEIARIYHWPALFLKNPFAEGTVNTTALARWRIAQFKLLRDSILHKPLTDTGRLDKLACSQEERPLIDLVKGKIKEAHTILEMYRTTMDKKLELKQETWDETEFLKIVFFVRETFSQTIQSMESCLYGVSVEVTEALAEQGDNPSPTLQELRKALNEEMYFVNSLLAASIPLFHYCEEREMIREEEAKKIRQVKRGTPVLDVWKEEEVIEPKKEEVASAGVVLAPPPQNLNQLYRHVKGLATKIAANCQKFVSQSRERDDLLRVEMQNSCATNLAAALEDLEEVIEGSPLMIHNIALVEQSDFILAVAIEQALTLMGAILSPTPSSKPQDFLRAKHNPYQLAEALKPKGLNLSAEQRKLCHELRRVIPISSRYPVTGGGVQYSSLVNFQKLLSFIRDNPQKDLRFILERRLKEAQERIKLGLTILLDTLQLIPEPEPQATQVSISMKQLKDAFQPIPSINRLWPSQIGAAAQKLRQTLEQVRHLSQERAILGNLAVPIHEDENPVSLKLRTDTIEEALKNIPFNSELFLATFTTPADANLAVTTLKRVTLKRSALLEQTLHLLLAHLPCQEGPDHFLVSGSKLKPWRYSHALSHFVQRLVGQSPQLMDDPASLHAEALELGPYLQNGYRYNQQCQGKAREHLDRIKLLLFLYRAPNLSFLTFEQQAFLDKALGIQGEQKENARRMQLKKHIETYLQSIIFPESLETLNHVQHLLEGYVALLKSERAKWVLGREEAAEKAKIA